MTDRMTNNRYWKPWVDGPDGWDEVMVYPGDAKLDVMAKGRSMWELVRCAHRGGWEQYAFDESHLGDMRVSRSWYIWIGAYVANEWREDCHEYEYLPDLYDLWDEWGAHCPWRRVAEGTPGAVAWVHIWDAREVAA